MHSTLAGFSVFAALTPFALSACTRSTLQTGTDTYLSSQSSGQLAPSFSGIPYVQNNKTVDISSSTSIFQTALKIDHNKTIIDTEACKTYTELISTSPGEGHVIGTQITYMEDGMVMLVDSIVTTKGDWLFNASKTLETVKGENWGAIDAPKRDSRDTIKKAIDAYLDLWGNSNAPVPWGTPCRRLEGSAYTGSGSANDSCNVGIPGGNQPPVTNRRYVVDEEYGSANVLCDFGAMRSGAPDSHEVRLENGKLRFVHTMTVMTARNSSSNV